MTIFAVTVAPDGKKAIHHETVTINLFWLISRFHQPDEYNNNKTGPHGDVRIRKIPMYSKKRLWSKNNSVNELLTPQ